MTKEALGGEVEAQRNDQGSQGSEGIEQGSKTIDL